jgi:hypothetical protein
MTPSTTSRMPPSSSFDGSHDQPMTKATGPANEKSAHGKR